MLGYLLGGRGTLTCLGKQVLLQLNGCSTLLKFTHPLKIFTFCHITATNFKDRFFFGVYVIDQHKSVQKGSGRDSIHIF